MSKGCLGRANREEEKGGLVKSLTVQCSSIKLEDTLIEHASGSRREEEGTPSMSL